MYKKFIKIFSLFALVLGSLTGCGGDNTNKTIDEIKAKIKDFGAANSDVLTAGFDLPKTVNDVELTWKSSNDKSVAIAAGTGEMYTAVVILGVSMKEVTLTASFQVKKKSASQDISIKVGALPIMSPKTIVELRDTATIAIGTHTRVDDLTVTAKIINTDKKTVGFYAVDANKESIYVYCNIVNSVCDIAQKGDVVTVIGATANYYGNLQLAASGTTKPLYVAFSEATATEVVAEEKTIEEVHAIFGSSTTAGFAEYGKKYKVTGFVNKITAGSNTNYHITKYGLGENGANDHIQVHYQSEYIINNANALDNLLNKEVEFEGFLYDKHSSTGVVRLIYAGNGVDIIPTDKVLDDEVKAEGALISAKRNIENNTFDLGIASVPTTISAFAGSTITYALKDAGDEAFITITDNGTKLEVISRDATETTEVVLNASAKVGNETATGEITFAIMSTLDAQPTNVVVARSKANNDKVNLEGIIAHISEPKNKGAFTSTAIGDSTEQGNYHEKVFYLEDASTGNASLGIGILINKSVDITGLAVGDSIRVKGLKYIAATGNLRESHYVKSSNVSKVATLGTIGTNAAVTLSSIADYNNFFKVPGAGESITDISYTRIKMTYEFASAVSGTGDNLYLYAPGASFTGVGAVGANSGRLTAHAFVGPQTATVDGVANSALPDNTKIIAEMEFIFTGVSNGVANDTAFRIIPLKITLKAAA